MTKKNTSLIEKITWILIRMSKNLLYLSISAILDWLVVSIIYVNFEINKWTMIIITIISFTLYFLVVKFILDKYFKKYSK